jgi:carbon storage regulator
MLILTRYKQEKILIGDNVEITLIGVNRDGQVKIGIDAPKDVSILREEISYRFEKEGRVK